jgi:hypothetical protein
VYQNGRLTIYKRLKAVQGLKAIFYMFIRKYPQIEWMEDSVWMLREVEKALPKMLLKKR